MAKKQGTYTLNFDTDNIEKELKKLTSQKGPDKIIDAVGVDAEHPHCCSMPFFKSLMHQGEFSKEQRDVAPNIHPSDGNWVPGSAPSQVLDWAVKTVAKAGIISIIGVYPEQMRSFMIGKAMGKNLTLRMGNCNHRAYIPKLLKWVQEGSFNPLPFITQKLAFNEVIDAYKCFDKREDNWIKVVLTVQE